MIKKSSILVAATVALFGCGSSNQQGSSANVDSTALAAATPSVCNCEDLKYQKEKYFLGDAVEPYTGDCTEMDKFDSVIATKTYERGFLMHVIERQRVHGSYQVTRDMTYDIEGKQQDGFRLTFSNAGLGDDNQQYVYSTEEWKSGKKISEWTIHLSYLDWATGPSFSISIESDNEETPPTCMPADATYDPSHFIADREGGTGARTGTSTHFAGKWKAEIPMSTKDDFSEVDKVMECLKKEYPHFQYFRK